MFEIISTLKQEVTHNAISSLNQNYNLYLQISNVTLKSIIIYIVQG